MMTENEKKALSSVFSAVNKALTVADESTIMAMTNVGWIFKIEMQC